MDDPEQFVSEAEELAYQADCYRRTMIELKKISALAAKGPTDVPSVLIVRYVAFRDTPEFNTADEGFRLTNDSGDSVVVLHREDGFAVYERMINLGERAPDDEMPGKFVFDALSEFLEECPGVQVWTVAIVADGIMMNDPNDEEWKSIRELPDNAEKGLHELFRDEPQAQKWLSECINVFLMDSRGAMASATTRYSYDETVPPRPVFESDEAKYEGNVTEKDREWITSQRIVVQMIMFFAKYEQAMLATGDQGHRKKS